MIPCAPGGGALESIGSYDPLAFAMRRVEGWADQSMQCMARALAARRYR
jgi:hypothetical protein